MVDALREARRALVPSGILIDVRPVVAPIEVEVMIAGRVAWARTVHTYSAPDDVAAADAAVRDALSREWLVFETCVRFDFDIYSDTAADLRLYVEARKLRGAEVPYDELEARRRALGTIEQPARLRCRRPWMLATYCRK